MIHKIITLSNYANFSPSLYDRNDWDGCFKKNNLIFAPNGSGKTSFSILLESLNNKEYLIKKKRKYGAKENPKIIFIDDINKEISYKNGTWNKQLDVEVFNSLYLENNVYSIDVTDAGDISFLEAIVFDDLKYNMRRIANLNKQITKLRQKRHNYRNRRNKRIKAKDSAKNISELQTSMDSLQLEINNKIDEINVHMEKRKKRTEIAIQKYMSQINKLLTSFAPYLSISNIKPVYKSKYGLLKKLVYEIIVNNHPISINDRSETSLKYSLSEGDKNSLALSFFIAKLNLLPNLENRIVVIDDPFTSFDAHRKQITINEIANLSEKVKQLFVLSHDIQFQNDLYKKINSECVCLKLKKTTQGTRISSIALEKESMTGLIKDITLLHDFLVHGEDNETELLFVCRTIRPSLEGIFRIKYFNLVSSNQWLGNIIEMIRDSQKGEPFYRLKKSLPEIESINDFSKKFHHSNPGYLEYPLNFNEVVNYVERTIKLITEI